ncbi:hypothetical protein [Streptomyces erythrochromogenes]|uniref:hypothetical protein n=1 Tax=Streptomyces erythrochromogenes TaxID=285574 RepID=UPI0022578F79|nr:hypothetical protein [Streptomyces erythrochromogenes]MCX5589622.1 hypothetical protein [Streptomyces erythrochromogenes]
MTTLSFATSPQRDLAAPPHLAEPLYRLAALMRSINRPLDATELETAAAALSVLGMSYARLAHFQGLCLNPPRGMTRRQWGEVRHRTREAGAGVDWLHEHSSLPNADALLVNGAVAVLRTAAQGEQSIRLVQEVGTVLYGLGSHCAAIALAEQDPIEEDRWTDAPTVTSARIARAALHILIQASRIRGWDDAEEQCRIGLIEQACHLTQRMAA